MAWSRLSTQKRTLILGVTLILVVNAIVWAGVAYNRSGEPESVLRLSQRELKLPYEWRGNHENSGVSLDLQWKVPFENYDESSDPINANTGPKSNFLNTSKMAALGFDVTNIDQKVAKGSYADKQLSKEVLLVLELDGPAYQQFVENAKRHAEKEKSLCYANLDKEEFKRRANYAQETFEEAQREDTRLFVVDAGLDALTLRKVYPDKAHYAIVRGKVRSSISSRGSKLDLLGRIESVSIDKIDVPSRFHSVFTPLVEARRQGVKATNNPPAIASTAVKNSNPCEPVIKPRHRSILDALPYEVTVAFGQRLEPWITEVSAKAIAK